MILVLNVCREKLHYFEFVRPIEDVKKIMDFFGGSGFRWFGVSVSTQNRRAVGSHDFAWRLCNFDLEGVL